MLVELVGLQVRDGQIHARIRNVFESSELRYSSMAWGYADSSSRSCPNSRSASAIRRLLAVATLWIAEARRVSGIYPLLPVLLAVALATFG